MIIVGSIISVYLHVKLCFEGLQISGVWTCSRYIFSLKTVYFEPLVSLILLEEHCFALPLRPVSYLALPALMMITNFLEGQKGTSV